ncbi:MAG: signal peptidase I [Clostridia bacterium]|nr:signal peptidase I [Clostridia bacterium]MBQ7048817.1 signal peptidase I [Clostridia bacterium]
MYDEVSEKELPSSEQLEDELVRVKYKQRYKKLLKTTFFSLLVVAAISVLIATLFLPVLEIYGNSMNPTLENGEIVVSIKTDDLNRGDICCFYYNNQILVKRVIGTAGDTIVIEKDGTVIVNDVLLDEPYINEKAEGESDIQYPYTVPENTVFVLGDNRETSVDSRNALIGCIDVEEIVGKIVFRVWPLSGFGGIN